MTGIKLRFSQFDDSDGTFFNHQLTTKERERKKDINVYKRPNLANETKHDHNLVWLQVIHTRAWNLSYEREKILLPIYFTLYSCVLFYFERERESCIHLYLAITYFNTFCSHFLIFLFVLNRTFEISASQNVFQNPAQDWVAVRAVVYQDVLNDT